MSSNHMISSGSVYGETFGATVGPMVEDGKTVGFKGRIPNFMFFVNTKTPLMLQASPVVIDGAGFSMMVLNEHVNFTMTDNTGCVAPKESGILWLTIKGLSQSNHFKRQVSEAVSIDGRTPFDFEERLYAPHGDRSICFSVPDGGSLRDTLDANGTLKFSLWLKVVKRESDDVWYQ